MWSTKNILQTALRLGWILQHGKSNLQLDLCYTIYSLVVLIILSGLGDDRSLFSFASCTCNFWGGRYSRYKVVNLYWYMYGFISKTIASRLVHSHVLHIFSCQVFSCDVKQLTIWHKYCVYFNCLKRLINHVFYAKILAGQPSQHFPYKVSSQGIRSSKFATAKTQIQDEV